MTKVDWTEYFDEDVYLKAEVIFDRKKSTKVEKNRYKKVDLYLQDPKTYKYYSYADNVVSINVYQETIKKYFDDKDKKFYYKTQKKLLDTVYVGDFIPRKKAYEEFCSTCVGVGVSRNTFELACNEMILNDYKGIVKCYCGDCVPATENNAKVAQLDECGKLSNLKPINEILKSETSNLCL